MSPSLRGMEFHEFARARLTLLESQRHLVDAANTQLYQTLPQVDPRVFTPIQASDDSRSPHRCHLAEALCQHFGLEQATWKQRVMVSQGVRDSLGIMMRRSASERSTLWLPSDVYPVYLELAQHSGAPVKTYCARVGLDLGVLGEHRNWTLVVCDPLKPWGGEMRHEYREQLVNLARECGGRILVDGAYAPGFSPQWRKHIERDDPVAWLMSVSKGWLLPYRGGAAIAGDMFSSSWKSSFAASKCNTDGLRQAFAALVEQPNRPISVAAVVDRSRKDMLGQMAHRGIGLNDPGHGYLVACDQDPDTLAAKGILAVPASVFGSDWSGCVLSSLGWVKPLA